jgi:hypothetical protein
MPSVEKIADSIPYVGKDFSPSPIKQDGANGEASEHPGPLFQIVSPRKESCQKKGNR